MEKHSIGFKPEMIESKAHLLWACQVQLKEVSHLTGTSGISVICEDRGWTLKNIHCLIIAKCHHGND